MATGPDQLGPLPLVQLPSGAVVRLEAINPTTGAAVSGVRVTSATIFADSFTDAGGGTLAGEPLSWLTVADEG